MGIVGVDRVKKEAQPLLQGFPCNKILMDRATDEWVALETHWAKQWRNLSSGGRPEGRYALPHGLL